MSGLLLYYALFLAVPPSGRSSLILILPSLPLLYINPPSSSPHQPLGKITRTWAQSSSKTILAYSVPIVQFGFLPMINRQTSFWFWTNYMKVLESFALLNRFRTGIGEIQTLTVWVRVVVGGGGWIDTASLKVNGTWVSPKLFPFTLV